MRITPGEQVYGLYRRNGKKHGALRPQKPSRLIRDGEDEGGGRGQEFLYLTPTRYTVTNDSTLRWAAV